MELIVVMFSLLFSFAAFSAPELKVIPMQDTYDQVNFGQVYVNSVRWASFKVWNSGDEPLFISRVGIAGPMDFAAWYDCGTVIPVGGECMVDIRYWPNNPGHHTGTFIMNGVEDKWNLYIRLWGQAYH